MSLHKLTAGHGYTYLTRQVAAADATDLGHTSLPDFYAQKGESPGVWIGSGLSGLAGVAAGAHVSGEQMKALFGQGRHPDADKIGAAMIAAGHSPAQAERATALGRRYPIYERATQFRTEVAAAFVAYNTRIGARRNAPIPPDVRGRIRTDVGAQMFTHKHGRPPTDARELNGFMARSSRRPQTAVAGFDLTFSPVKSVSSLWALAPPGVAAQIQAAQNAAVTDTLGWLERDAAFTRTCTRGALQVEATALIGTAFTHRDARSGDPDLHTHVAISNKVQSLNGAWLALYGRVLFKAHNSASQRYDTRIEAELGARLGVRFKARTATDPSKRPVREVVGVDPRLNRFWSSRRADIEVRLTALSATFQVDHGRPPTAVEFARLAQQATLETRPGKHSPRSYAEQRATWSAQAKRVLGGDAAVQEMITAAMSGRRQAQAGTGPWVTEQTVTEQRVTRRWVDDVAAQVVATVSGLRPTWQVWHVRAEAERRARAAEVALVDLDGAVDRVVAGALSPAHSVPVGGPKHIAEPQIRRRDGSSVYSTPGGARFTSQAVMDAAAALVATAQRHGGRVLSETVVAAARSESAANGVNLNPGQPQPVQEMATSGARGQLVIGHGSQPQQLPADVNADIQATGGQLLPAADVGEALVRRVAAAADAAPLHGSQPPPGASGEGAPADPHLMMSDDADLPPKATPDVDRTLPRIDNEPPSRQSTPEVEGYHEALFHAARQREYAPAPDLDAVDTERQLVEANRWDHAAVPRARLLELNEMAADFFTAGYPVSWGPGYVRGRLGTDLADHREFRPGYAPGGWTNLTDHLRRLGVRDEEILAAGLSRVASTGRIIDQFRDRLVLPIRNGDQIHGFIGRRNPSAADADPTGPKYLNTPHTDLFDKSAQLFGLEEGRTALDAGASPVLVEGFFDAIAVTLAGAGQYVGVAPLGTSLTAAQANALRPYIGAERRGVTVATDADLAGQVGAQRAFWMLTARGDHPRLVAMPEGQDPAAVLQHAGPATLRACLHDAQPLARLLLDERLAHLGDELQVLSDCAAVVAAAPPHTWMEQIEYLATRTNHEPGVVHQVVADVAQRWTLDPLGGAQRQIGDLAAVRARLQRGAPAPPSGDRQSDLVLAAEITARGRGDSGQSGAPNSHGATAVGGRTTHLPLLEPWRQLAHTIDSRLTAGEDWPVLSRAIQEADAAGYDVAGELGQLAAQGKVCGEHCAAELAYQLRTATQTFKDMEPTMDPDQKRAALCSAPCDQPDTRTSRRPTGPSAR